MTTLFVAFCLLSVRSAGKTYNCGAGDNCNSLFIFPETHPDQTVFINCPNAGDCDGLIVYSSIDIFKIDCSGTNSCDGVKVYCGDFDPPGPTTSTDMDKTGIHCDVDCASFTAPGCNNTLLSCKGNDINQCRLRSLNAQYGVTSSTLECNMPTVGSGGIGCQMDCYDYDCLGSDLLCHGTYGSRLCSCNGGSPGCDDVTVTNGATYKPATSNPTTLRPSTANPTTIIPTTSLPTTINPTTNIPTTSTPTTLRPTTADPTTSRPTTSTPTTAIPTTSRPTTNIPSNAPITAVPTTSDPTTPDPTTNNPTTSIPSTSNPLTIEPTNLPTTYNPTSFSPTTDTPTTTSANEPRLKVPTDTKSSNQDGHQVVETTDDNTKSEGSQNEEGASQNDLFDNYLWLLLLGIGVLLVIIIVIGIWMIKRKRNAQKEDEMKQNIEIANVELTTPKNTNGRPPATIEMVQSDCDGESDTDDADGLFTDTTGVTAGGDDGSNDTESDGDGLFTQQHETAGGDMDDGNENITKGGEINNDEDSYSDNRMDEMYMKPENNTKM